MDTINDNNYELWLLRYAEGELDAARRAEVEAWLAHHPVAAEELALYAQAPRLEADKGVRYMGAIPGRTRRLWPVALRWAAAAAVVVALVVPLLRMGTTDGTGASRPARGEVVAGAEVPKAMGQGSAAPAVPAQPALAPAVPAQPTTEAANGGPARAATNGSPVHPAARPEAPAWPSAAPEHHGGKADAPVQEPPAAASRPTADEAAPLRPEIMNVGTLIAVEEDLVAAADHAAAEAPLRSADLIAVDNTADLGDLLLAANTMLRSGLETSALGQLAMRTLPDNERLEQRVVSPMRERRANRRHGSREDRRR